MIEVKTRRLCNFCNEVVRDDDTYSHGECTINLTYMRCSIPNVECEIKMDKPLIYIYVKTIKE